jgi:GT2 family glycosyltransferase/2-polyprenyl-3-methyl-5-hydroxy-6-metoxy-1,4-benzoquinol methylase
VPPDHEPDRDASEQVAIEDLRAPGTMGEGPILVPEGDALRYDTEVDLSNHNNSHALLVLLTGFNKRVLEVGCSTGFMTKILQERGCRVTGLEIDPVAARRAARFAERMIVADVEAIEFADVFPDERFDVIVFGDVLEHLVDPLAVLRHSASILAPEGAVLASIPNITHGSVRLALLTGRFQYTAEGLLDRTHLRFYDREGVEALFEDAGYVITDRRQTSLDLFETELGLLPEDHPPFLVDAVREAPDASTYQFLVRAEPVLPSDVPVPARIPEDVAEPARRRLWAVEERLARLERHMAGLLTELGVKDRVLAERSVAFVEEMRVLRLRLQDPEAARASEEQGRRWAVGELDRIKGSVAYRIAQGITRRLRRGFPQGTLRGRALGRFRRFLSRRLERRARRRAQPPVPETVPELPEGLAVALDDYRGWIETHEPSPGDLEEQARRATTLLYRPLVSVVVPTWNPPVELLREMVGSLQAQTYPHWELCIADGSSERGVLAALGDLERSDERIRIVRLDRNLGISGNTNEALKLATGEYTAFLDQTDVLAPFALYRVVEAVNRDPGIDVLYSDWDLLSEDGRVRFNPFFTPQWSPDLLLSANYMVHLSVVRTRLLREAGGLRPELDGAQDWDLLLRVTERTDRVVRIPAVLYHWRADSSSAAMSLAAKPHAEVAQRRAVEERLARRGESGAVVREDDGQLRIRWAVSEPPKVSILIPTKDNRPLLGRCLEAIRRSSYTNREVIVIETAGRTPEREEWYEHLEGRFRCRVLWWEQPFNYSAVNNWAARESQGDILLFMNDDTEPLTEDWLEEVVGWLRREDVGIVGTHLLGEDDTIQHGGVIIGMGGFAEHLFRGLRPGSWSLMGSTMWYRNTTAVTGACLAVTRRVFEEAGGWDERFVLCGSDVELCLRVRRAGFRVVVTPRARLRHIEGATRGDVVPEEDFCLSFWHYQGELYGGDPFFNPSLSYEDPIPRLARPEDRHPAVLVSTTIGRDLTPRPPGDEQGHAAVMAESSLVSPSDVQAIAASHRAVRGARDIGSVTWFIPDFENPFYGGIHTIFRFADHLREHHGVENRFVVVGTGPERFIRSGLQATFPGIADVPVHVAPGGSAAVLATVPRSDAAIATLWVTAYPMAEWRGADRYFYFVQDFEPMFYPAGTMYALAEETYRMGLYGIANTPPLQEIYGSYGWPSIGFTPCVDAEVFHPNRPQLRPDDPLTVFMYGRPGHPRNCYELAVAALRRVKERLADRVRIVTAGSWAGGETEPWLDHLGLLDYRATADLYRRCDAGLVLSVSKHPTYIPLQLMACGALVVANDNPANGWLLRNQENCLLADPTAEVLAAALERGLLDDGLRATLTARATSNIEERHTDWAGEIERVYDFMRDPRDPSLATSV